MMFLGSPNKKQSAFLERLGLLLVYWNQLEEQTRGIMEVLSGGNWQTKILTVHMGSVSMCDALRTLCAEFVDTEIQPHLAHYITYFEILREYRNYYAHAVVTVYKDGNANLGAWSARSKLVMHNEIISASELDQFLCHCETLSGYGTGIALKITEFLILEKGSTPPFPPDKRPTLPEKPPLPDRLEKNRQLILREQPPPRSSPG